MQELMESVNSCGRKFFSSLGLISSSFWFSHEKVCGTLSSDGASRT